MKSCHQPCKNRTTNEKPTDGIRRFPSAIFSGAGDTLQGFLPALFRNEKTVIQTEFCTFVLHSSYTAKICGIRWNKISGFQKVSHPRRMTKGILMVMVSG